MVGEPTPGSVPVDVIGPTPPPADVVPALPVPADLAPATADDAADGDDGLGEPLVEGPRIKEITQDRQAHESYTVLNVGYAQRDTRIREGLEGQSDTVVVASIQTLRTVQEITTPLDFQIDPRTPGSRPVTVEEGGQQYTIQSLIAINGDTFTCIAKRLDGSVARDLKVSRTALINRQIVAEQDVLTDGLSATPELAQLQGLYVSAITNEGIIDVSRLGERANELNGAITEAGESVGWMSTETIQAFINREYAEYPILESYPPEKRAELELLNARIKTTREAAMSKIVNQNIVDPKDAVDIIGATDWQPQKFTEAATAAKQRVTQLDFLLSLPKGTHKLDDSSIVTVNSRAKKEWQEQQLQAQAEYEIYSKAETAKPHEIVQRYFTELQAGTISAEDAQIVVSAIKHGDADLLLTDADKTEDVTKRKQKLHRAKMIKDMSDSTMKYGKLAGIGLGAMFVVMFMSASRDGGRH